MEQHGLRKLLINTWLRRQRPLALKPCAWMGFATRLGRVLLLSEGVEQSGEESSFAFHPCAVIGTSDSRSFQQLLERGFQTRRLLRQRWYEFIVGDLEA